MSSRSLGGESNREIDFGFGSCVRARSGCRVGTCSKVARAGLPFPFRHGDFSLFPLGSMWVQVIPSETKRCQVRPSETQWNQAIPRETKLSQVRPSKTKWDQVGLNETEKVQVRSSEATWKQMNPNESKFDQVRPSESKWDQVRPSESKWDQVRPSESPPLPPILLSNFSWLYRYPNHIHSFKRYFKKWCFSKGLNLNCILPVKVNFAPKIKMVCMVHMNMFKGYFSKSWLKKLSFWQKN